MTTKYNTGDAVMIPAFIRSARSVDGVIVYDVETNRWDGVREDEIEPASRISSKALMELVDQIPRY